MSGIVYSGRRPAGDDADATEAAAVGRGHFEPPHAEPIPLTPPPIETRRPIAVTIAIWLGASAVAWAIVLALIAALT